MEIKPTIYILAEDSTDKINFTNIEDVREKYRKMKKDSE
jgi:hypothetical protein